MQCPDCDSVKMFCDPPEENGECSACHGTGFGTIPETRIPEFADDACEECFGSGQCHTCRGTGVTEEPEIKIAA